MLLNFLFLVLLFQICNSVDSITPKHSLAGDDLLVSEDGKFALGFFKPGNSNYTYLGIWYQKITIQTVIWVANRNNPIRGSSGKLLINPKGNLILYDHQDFKFPVWSTNVSAEKTNFSCEAQLLNTGNLVLVLSGSRVTLWQSFDYPTDTLLPGMKLGLDLHTGQDLFLTAWKSVDDPAIGNYLLRLNTVGSPQFFLYNGSIPQWRSHPWPWPTHSETGQAGYVYRITFAKNEEEIYYTYLVDDESLLIRTSVDPFGLLRRVTWDYSSHQWKATLSAPIYAYGHCGPYSLCDSSRSFECTCLPGYAPKLVKDWDLRDASSGCIRKREATLSMCRNREGFVKLSSVKLPDTSIASLLNTSMTVSGCEQLCLGNCKCKAYAAVDIQRKGDGCLTWYGELSDATAYTNGYDLYVRVDSIELAESSPRRSNRFLEKKGRLVIIVLAAGLSALLIILSVFWWLKKKRLTTVKRRLTRRICSVMTANGLVEGSQHPDLTFFNLETISTATNNFSPANKLGQGGFGTVYKGKLLDGQEIAVKRLSRSSVQGVEEFVNEIILIARLQHRNLVKLLGCCIQGEEQMLIYEYLQNKSLDSFIFDQAQKLLLDWRQRFEIIIAIARGIMYLHHDSRLRIIHRDLKTSNILLDNRMNPKISDFGLARIFGGDQDQDMTKRVAGTYGYMSPEYITFGKYSTKSDVFGFGVILLEIITGKKSCSRYEEELSLNLMEHVWDMWREHRVNELVDSSLLTNAYVPSEVLRCVQIGLLCVEEDSMDRPNMSEVVLMLNGDTALPFPKRPAFVSRSNHEINASAPRKDSCSANEVTVSSVKPR